LDESKASMEIKLLLKERGKEREEERRGEKDE
jgi:hypothetical protein